MIRMGALFVGGSAVLVCSLFMGIMVMDAGSPLWGLTAIAYGLVISSILWSIVAIERKMDQVIQRVGTPGSKRLKVPAGRRLASRNQKAE